MPTLLNMPVASVDVCLWGDCVAKLLFSLRIGLPVSFDRPFVPRSV
jgi:hypothetical protein